MWVAACDDDISFLNSFKKSLLNILSPDDTLTTYNGGFQLLDDIYKSKGSIDVLFLDIVMPGLTGLESAKEIKQVSPDTTIVIVTNYDQYALQGYDIEAFKYLIKPVEKNVLADVVENLRERHEKAEKNYISLNRREGISFIDLKDIVYIHVEKRTLYVNTRTNSYPWPSKKINDLATELYGYGFYKVHKSYVVNCAHIRFLDTINLKTHMSNGKIIPVGNRNFAQLKKYLMNYRKL